MNDPQPQPQAPTEPVAVEAEITPVDELLTPGPDPDLPPADATPSDPLGEEPNPSTSTEAEGSPEVNPEAVVAADGVDPAVPTWTGSNPSAPTDPELGEARPYNPPVRKGDTTAYVRKAQVLVRNYGGVNCDVNGIFDRAFELEVLALQKKHGIDETGEVDDATWDLLRQLKANA